MRMMVLVAVFGIILLLSGGAAGQETSHFLVPYGFHLPLMEQGEYLLSVNGHYHQDKSVTEYDDNYSLDDWNQYKYTYAYISADAIYAFSRQFLLGASLQFAPGQDAIRQDCWSQDYLREYNLGRLTRRINPAVALVYRPLTNLEIHCAYNFTSSKEKGQYFEDMSYKTNPEYFRFSDANDTYHYVTVGLTYHGKL